MITEELLNFIRTQYAANMSVSEMKHLLLTEGEWNDEDVNEALRTLGIPLSPAAPPSDDFLGIFSSDAPTEHAHELHPKKTEKAVETSAAPVSFQAPIPPPEPVHTSAPAATPVPEPVHISPPAPSPARAFTPAHELVHAPTPAPEIAHTPPSTTTPASAAAPSVIKFTPPPPTRHVIPLQPASAPPRAKFDLSMFRKNISSGAALDTKVTQENDTFSERSPRTVKTKSIAEAWLQGKELPNAESGKPRGPITWEGKTPLVAIRTMSSDIILLSKDKVVPEGTLPPPPSLTIKEVIEEAKQKEKIKEASEEKLIAAKLNEADGSNAEAPLDAPKEEQAGETQFILPEAPRTIESETKTSTSGETVFHDDVTPAGQGNALEKLIGNGSIFDKLSKNVKAKTIAEMWLEDAEETVQGLSKTNSAPSEERPVAERRDTSADLLLRGRGKVIPGIPAIFVPPDAAKEELDEESAEENIKKNPKKEPEISSPPKHDAAHDQAVIIPHFTVPSKPEAPSSGSNTPVGISTAPMEIVSHGTPHEFIETLIEKNIVKKALPFMVGVLILTTLIIGVLYATVKLRGPDVALLLANATQQFYDLTTFAYQGSGSADLVLSTAADGEREEGKIKFSFNYSGALKNESDGYGDGKHHIKFTGGIMSSDLTWETDIDAEIVVVGQTLYFHVLSLPEGISADPELFKTYWVAVDLAEIARELALDGLKTGLDEYGGFAREHITLNEALKKNFPFTVDKRLADEMQNGVMSHRFRLKSDPDRMAELIRILYRTYTNKELALNVDQELRFKQALEKIGGNVWVNENTGALVKFAFSGDLDDDVVGVHVKGPLSFDFSFADFNKPITVSNPSPILTLEETRVRMDDFKVIMEKRTRDMPHITVLHTIEKALADYYEIRGRYPTLLSELMNTNVIDSGTVSTTTLKRYYYAAYLSDALLMKSMRCTASSKTCVYYHLGVNLEDTTNPALAGDADITSDVRGKDASGCGTERGFSCFDVTAPVRATSTSP